MSGRWAAALELSQARLLGPLRLWLGLEACAVAETVWLRAMSFDSALDAACQRLPGAARFQVLDDGQLLPAGALVPRGYLPEGDWTPLDRWLGVLLPLAQRSAGHAPPVRLQLVRSTVICRPTILRLSLKSWAAFSERAAQLRLGCLSFLASRDGQALVRGNPLPPLPGEQFVDHDGIVVPAGWSWQPAVDPQVVRAAAQLEPGDCLLWTADGGCQRLPADGWVRGSRSAVRLTLAGVVP